MQQLRQIDLTPPLSSVSDILPPVQATHWTQHGTTDFRRAVWALFLAGFASYSLIYCVQPLLPEFPREFGVNAATAALAMSATTGCLAFAILLSGAFAEIVSRRTMIFVSMALAAVFNLMAASTQNWTWLLAARAAEGMVLGGVPAVAMAYLAEEIQPRSLGKAMGIYVGGTAFGAMFGRVAMGLMSAVTTWQTAMYALGAICLASAIGFLVLLPASRNFRPERQPLSRHLQLWWMQLRNPTLLRLYFIGAMLTSVFTTIFNYCAFRLIASPFDLSRTSISLIYLTLVLGVMASSYGGALVDRLGRRAMLAAGFAIMLAGVLLTLSTSLVVMITGIALIVVGFYAGHSAASSGIGAHSGSAKCHASSLYLLAYYIGASLTGWIGGWFWIEGGWSAVAALTAGCAVLGIIAALSLAPTRR